MAVYGRRREAWTASFYMGSGTRCELTAGGFTAVERARYFGEVETEDVVQEKARPLQRRKSFEQQHQRHRNVVHQVARGVIIERFIHDRLGQPLADVNLAPRLRRLHAI